jgi:hypothetical protein
MLGFPHPRAEIGMVSGSFAVPGGLVVKAHLVASSASITWELNATPSRQAFSSHLLSPIDTVSYSSSDLIEESELKALIVPLLGGAVRMANTGKTKPKGTRVVRHLERDTLRAE